MLLGIAAGSILILMAGYDPVIVFSAMLRGTFTTNAGQSYLLTYMATLILTALAFLIPGKAGIWNVGAQGQVYLAGITTALIALFLPVPAFLIPLFAFLGGGSQARCGRSSRASSSRTGRHRP